MENNELIKYTGGLIRRLDNAINITSKLLATTEPQLKSYEKKEDFKYIGNNEQNIIILIKEESVEYIQELTLKKINWILTACKLELKDVAIFNLKEQEIKIDNLFNSMIPKVILIFGLGSNDIHLPLSLNINEIKIYNGCKILSTESIEALFQKDFIQSSRKKKELWESLKKIFYL
jgi:hypothetical protein